MNPATLCGFMLKKCAEGLKKIKRMIYLLALTFLIGLLSYILDTRPAMAVTLPNGFEHGLVTSIPDPTALAFTPDGRLLIASRTGQVRVYKGGQQSTALDIESTSCPDQARGLLGLTLIRSSAPTATSTSTTRQRSERPAKETAKETRSTGYRASSSPMTTP